MSNDHERGRGAILIDGNHVFITVLQQLDKFLELMSDSEIARQLETLPAFFEKFRRDTGKHPIVTYRSSLNAGDYADVAFNDILINGLSVLTSHCGISEVDWFDAEMGTPEDVLAVVTKKYERKRAQSAKSPNVTHHPSTTQRPRHFELIEAGKYHFVVEDGKSVILPFSVKNDFISEMYRKWQGTPVHAGLGFRDFYIDRAGAVRSNEKRVHTQLSIRGADIAHDPHYSHATLITNDGDHAPTVKRLLRGGKRIQIFSATLDYFQSRELKKAAGEENCMTLASAMRTINRQEEMEKAFGRHFVRSIDACPLFFPLANRFQRDIPYLASTGMTSFQFLQYQVDQTLKEKYGFSDEKIAEASV